MPETPSKKTTQARRRAISEQAMVDAAVELINELGITGTTLREVVKERATVVASQPISTVPRMA